MDNKNEMNELSLFTGIGGGLLGTKLLGWKCIGAVEWDEYCCKVLDQRIRDGIYEQFDIFNMDIREFNRRVATIYRGKVDVITAGFPCQPFSVAGKRRGDQDERNMWPPTIECIRLVRPRYLLLENVPGLLVHKYVRRIYGDLAESGYCVKWRCLSAAEVGANHKRNRWWIVADSDSNGSDSRRKQVEGRLQEIQGHRSCDVCEEVADTENTQHRLLGQGICREEADVLRQLSWWSVEPDVGRLADGVPNRVDRLKAIGNAQVPAMVKKVWELLNEN